MKYSSEVDAGNWLLPAITILGSIAIILKPRRTPGREQSIYSLRDWMRAHYSPVVSGAVAYGAYVAADFLGGSPFPQFLREHLFDGLAPAALVGILVDAFPNEDPVRAFPRIRRPIAVLLMITASGAAVFGLIAAAAVFGAAGENYGKSIGTVAGYGGYMFFLLYVTSVSAARGHSKTIDDYWPHKAWWFKKRSQDETGLKIAGKEGSSDPASHAKQSKMRQSPGGD
jgi:hypothetical protein